MTTTQDQYDREYAEANRAMRQADRAAVARVTGTAHSIEDGPKPGTVVITETCLHALLRAAEGRWRP